MKLFLLGIVLILGGCGGTPNIDTYDNLKVNMLEEQSEDFEFKIVAASIENLEQEINNGGFNQYFFNSSGQTCYQTLELLKLEKGQYYSLLSRLLTEAIEVINQENLTEEELVEKLRRRRLNSLDDNSVNSVLDSLNLVYYKYVPAHN